MFLITRNLHMIKLMLTPYMCHTRVTIFMKILQRCDFGRDLNA